MHERPAEAVSGQSGDSPIGGIVAHPRLRLVQLSPRDRPTRPGPHAQPPEGMSAVSADRIGTPVAVLPRRFPYRPCDRLPIIRPSKNQKEPIPPRGGREPHTVEVKSLIAVIFLIFEALFGGSPLPVRRHNPRGRPGSRG
jgi:hypothetical protein